LQLLYYFIKLLSKRANKLTFGRALIFAPHPDDEIFGLGGFILKLISGGVKISIIYLTDGENSGVWHDKDEIRNQRIALSEKVIKNLGCNKSDIYRLHLRDGSVPHRGQPGFEEVVMKVKLIINSIHPDTVYSVHTLDYWPYDHVACAQIAYDAVIESDVKAQLWYYWVWAWYNIRLWQLLRLKRRNLLKVDIRDRLNGKIELTDIYLRSLTTDGKPWCGILPNRLLKAFRYPYEIMERIL
jgi:LmbE family N-acetylglucosaminyl deacetylase